MLRSTKSFASEMQHESSNDEEKIRDEGPTVPTATQNVYITYHLVVEGGA